MSKKLKIRSGVGRAQGASFLLVDDVLVKILDQLSIQDVSRASAACRSWRLAIVRTLTSLLPVPADMTH